MPATQPGPLLVPVGRPRDYHRDLPRLQRLDSPSSASPTPIGSKASVFSTSTTSTRPCAEMEHCAEMGLVGVFIPSSPLWERPYRDPIYEKLWWTAQDVDLPLLLHIGSNRGGIPGCELTIDTADLTAAGFATIDYLGQILHDLHDLRRCVRPLPEVESGLRRARDGVDPPLAQTDGLYLHGTAGAKPKAGMALQARVSSPATIGARTSLWSSWKTTPASRCVTSSGWTTCSGGTTSPTRSPPGPSRCSSWTGIFQGVPDEERRKITSETAAKIFKFTLPLGLA